MTGQDVQALSDRLEIQDLLTTYAAAVDERDWVTFRGVFTSDAVLDYTAFGGPRGSVEEVVEWTAKALSAVAVSQHLVTNARIVLGGDEASARTEVFSPLALDAGGHDVMLAGGSYSDRLRRTAEGWRITERVARLAWSDRPVKIPR